jgi:hypothetical protein
MAKPGSPPDRRTYGRARSRGYSRCRRATTKGSCTRGTRSSWARSRRCWRRRPLPRRRLRRWCNRRANAATRRTRAHASTHGRRITTAAAVAATGRSTRASCASSGPMCSVSMRITTAGAAQADGLRLPQVVQGRSRCRSERRATGDRVEHRSARRQGKREHSWASRRVDVVARPLLEEEPLARSSRIRRGL